MHSLRVQADALFSSVSFSSPPQPPLQPQSQGQGQGGAAAAPHSSIPTNLQGARRLFYDAPLRQQGEEGGRVWGNRDLAWLRRRMPHVPLASLLKLVAE